jgi:hypothetical protein
MTAYVVLATVVSRRLSLVCGKCSLGTLDLIPIPPPMLDLTCVVQPHLQRVRQHFDGCDL